MPCRIVKGSAKHWSEVNEVLKQLRPEGQNVGSEQCVRESVWETVNIQWAKKLHLSSQLCSILKENERSNGKLILRVKRKYHVFQTRTFYREVGCGGTRPKISWNTSRVSAAFDDSAACSTPERDQATPEVVITSPAGALPAYETFTQVVFVLVQG